MKLISLSLLAISLFPFLSIAHRRSFGPQLSHQIFETPTISSTTNSNLFVYQGYGDPEDVLKGFLRENLYLSENDYVVKNMYRSSHSGVTHVYLRQIVNGLEVSNGDMNVNIDRRGNVISYGNSFYQGRKPSSINPELVQVWTGQPGAGKMPMTRYSRQFQFFSQPQTDPALITPLDAISNLYSYLDLPIPTPSNLNLVVEQSFDGDKPSVKVVDAPFSKSDIPIKPVYIQVNNGEELKLAWDLELELEDSWYHGQIGAEEGEIHSLVDWVADAQYNVFPLGTNDPNDGNRALLVNPESKNASPLGWHDQGNGNKFTTTAGNNVYAQGNLDGGDNWIDNYRPDGDTELDFDFPLNLNKHPKKYLDASITNLFYINNIIHDLFYQYGFTEEAGNFQENNFGKGGIGNDAVIANAQDGSGFNNANFATPPDGRNGRMRMYVWNVVKPFRDGDLESGIVIHEYCHGISTRLTGGPSNSGCLGWGEAGGMGEGWGDFFATIVRMKPGYNRTMDFDIGSYSNGGNGIRKFPYSTDLKVNTETFGVMDNPGYWGVHAKGAVWANMLFEVYWNLVDKLGFTKDWNSVSPKYGNTLMFQLVVDGMKLQPCRPSFIDARDAILQAEEQLTNGTHACDIWKGFAKRGLGVGAKTGGIFMGQPRKESYEVPERCR